MVTIGLVVRFDNVEVLIPLVVVDASGDIVETLISVGALAEDV